MKTSEWGIFIFSFSRHAKVLSCVVDCAFSLGARSSRAAAASMCSFIPLLTGMHSTTFSPVLFAMLGLTSRPEESWCRGAAIVFSGIDAPIYGEREREKSADASKTAGEEAAGACHQQGARGAAVL
ncbi:hypothetical protein DQ04_09481000, partial [Trypanosoma grayi]|uniref:hypothetical protein n=1 Tax=Trypanosoma grayi TaxID=71804 RepID=UPI0004F49015